MIAVTGMHRSGTSCITGLLVKCGFALGTSHPLLNIPARENPKGHFENLTAVALNDLMLSQAGGDWYQLPSPEKIVEVGQRCGIQIAQFSETFNGAVFKDPRLCLTLPVWKEFCPNLEAAILCIRNPIGVAGSLKRRNKFPVEYSLQLWYEYNLRFIQSAKNLPVLIVDYDFIDRNLESELSNLLSDLGCPLAPAELKQRIDGFYSSELNHDISEERHLNLLPENVRKLYEILLSQTYAHRLKDAAAA